MYRQQSHNYAENYMSYIIYARYEVHLRSNVILLKDVSTGSVRVWCFQLRDLRLL
jgi:hypothetical protein